VALHAADEDGELFDGIDLMVAVGVKVVEAGAMQGAEEGVAAFEVGGVVEGGDAGGLELVEDFGGEFKVKVAEAIKVREDVGGCREAAGTEEGIILKDLGTRGEGGASDAGMGVGMAAGEEESEHAGGPSEFRKITLTGGSNEILMSQP